jgi:hypothetical protein
MMREPGGYGRRGVASFEYISSAIGGKNIERDSENVKAVSPWRRSA